MVVLAVAAGPRAVAADPAASASPAHFLGIFEVQSLDGAGNNPFVPSWGKAGTNYTRVAPARYADGKSQPVSGPNTRYLSNRVFNDVSQNLFSERRVSQWGFTWGQFVDHTIGHRDETGEPANIPFTASDPLESFVNDLGVVQFNRSKAAPGTGVTNTRQQANTVGSYLDLSATYGDDAARLEWLRSGPVDGDLGNNSAALMLPGGYLPTRDARGNPATAPTMDINGRLIGQPTHAVVAGDVRANESLALTATQTLFAREHNRIVSLLPSFLSQEDKFQIARRVVIAEQQYITYTEFLPSLGVQLPAYDGYDPFTNANVSQEFAAVGYRAHSQIHGEVEVEAEAARYTAAQLASFAAQGIEVTHVGADVKLVIPLNVAFFNPDLVKGLQLGPLLEGIGAESEYKNDEQIDNQLRSVLFQIPVPGNPGCLDGPTLPQCFRGVVDLGAIDTERGRDHGLGTYNQLRKAYGLPVRTSFAAITGEASESWPVDPLLTPGNEINDPNSLDFVSLRDINGNPLPLGDQNNATSGTRRTPLAARLKATYGNVNNVDAFVGMVAEPHVAGTEFGELQLAIWTKQFQNLRDGDRFFYDSDPSLGFISDAFGIDFHHTLAQVIASNTDIPLSDLRANVFLLDGPAATAADGAAVADSGHPTAPDTSSGAALATTPTAQRRGSRRRR